MASLARGLRILVDPRFRSEWLLARRRPDNLFQPSGHTWGDRYEVFFSFVRDQMIGVTTPRLLSFGCSTGDEVFNLRRLFPQADIAGIDINPRSIAVARKRLRKTGDPAITFELSNSAQSLPEAHFDAIFCMAVFRHGDLEASRPDSCADKIDFADFERTVTGMCRCLRPGGYLVLRHSHFRFEDTQAFAAFKPVYRHRNRRGAVLLYGADNRRVEGALEQDVVFRKRAGCSGRCAGGERQCVKTQ